MREVYVAGTRSFAAEVVDFARDAGLRVAGLVETSDADRVGETIHGLSVRGLTEKPSPGAPVVVGTGTDGPQRRALVGRLVAAGWEVSGLVHPRAHLAPTAHMSIGVVAGPGVVLGAHSSVGDHVVLGRGTLVGHHTEIGAFATLGPGTNVGGNTRLEEDVFVGMGAVIRDHTTIGKAAVVAMGAVVVSSVPPGTEVRGLPARPVRAQTGSR